MMGSAYLKGFVVWDCSEREMGGLCISVYGKNSKTAELFSKTAGLSSKTAGLSPTTAHIRNNNTTKSSQSTSAHKQLPTKTLPIYFSCENGYFNTVLG